MNIEGSDKEKKNTKRTIKEGEIEKKRWKEMNL